MTDNSLKTVYVSWFTTARETKPDYEVEVGWLGLAGLLTNPYKRRITTDEQSVPLISFARFEGTRSSNNVKAITAVVLNFDGTVKYETVRQAAAGYESVAYSGHRHTAEKPQFRLILVPSREITLAEWPRLQAAANAMSGNKADGTTRDAAHIFTVPSAPAERREIAFAHHNRGRLLDPDLLLSPSSASGSVMSLSSADFVAMASAGNSARSARRSSKK